MRLIQWTGVVLSAALVVFGLGCEKPGSEGSEDNVTFAVVNGKEIKGKEVLEKVKNDLSELEKNAYEIKKRATDELVQKIILEDEAKKQGSTVDKMMGQFDDAKDKDVSKDDIKNFLKARNIDEKKLSKQEKESVPQIIKMQRVYEARSKFMGELRSKANVQYKLKKPVEKPVEVGTGNIDPMGNKNAKVKIVEFSDFQCPYCARGRSRLDEILAKYKDKVAIYFRHFPLESIHPQAFKAAEASLCAQDQGKFWEYHNALFDNQGSLSEPDLLKRAKELKLDDKAFADCLKSGKKAADVKKDAEEGMKIGVNSTPSFFVNGFPVRGAQPIEVFSELIDEQLAK